MSTPRSRQVPTVPSSPPLPRGMLAVGKVPALLLRRGLPMGPLRLLATTGRTSGRVHLVPVVVLRADGGEWLVSPFGDTGWVRNVRRSGTAHMGRGRRLAPITLTERDPAGTAELLRTYRRRFGVIPFVRRAFTATGSDPSAAFAAEAEAHPVFAIGPAPNRAAA